MSSFNKIHVYYKNSTCFDCDNGNYEQQKLMTLDQIDNEPLIFDGVNSYPINEICTKCDKPISVFSGYEVVLKKETIL